MVDEVKEVSFSKLQEEVKELISFSKRRNVFTEVKDLIHGDVCLSLRDVIILYQSYLKDCFKEFYDAKETLEQRLSKDLSYPVRLSLSLVQDNWRQDKTTPENLKKYWYHREYDDCCLETVSMDIFYNHQNNFLFKEVYWNHKHDSYLKNKNMDSLQGIYLGYKKDLKKIMRLYYKGVSSISSFKKFMASDTEKSHVEVSIFPFYLYESRDASGDSYATGEWHHSLYYYKEEAPINLLMHKVSLFRLKPWHCCGNIFMSLDLDYQLRDARLYDSFCDIFRDDSVALLITKDSDSRLLPEVEFMISKAFPNFKVYLKDLPDFFSRYLEEYRGTDYFIEGKKRFDRGKEKEKIKELQIVDKVKQLVANNNLKIVKLVKKNQGLYEKLGERQPITKDILCKMVQDEEGGHWIIRPEFREDLEYYDLSGISFDNVDVREIDFRNTNIKSSHFNPQTVYHKDLSGCYFEVCDEDIDRDRLFDYSTDFTDVNLESTTIKQPLSLYNNTISGAIINQHTVLPEELWDIRRSVIQKNHKD